ncbi:signal peptidase II [Phycicoccus sp. Soil802]|uniref:signal peptidase II n=1 Tax=Phycicoccus sp. Soil802 TaxID=1736414 RepID=UPI00138EDEED|nr:signal peptidase II [Phycicoccus sp. Soil802]
MATGMVLVSAALVVVVDLSTKHLAATYARPHTAGDVAAVGLVRPVTNPAFSLGLVGAAPTSAVLLMALVLAAGMAASVIYVRRAAAPPWAVGLTLGGAAANTIDRALHRAVQDFIVTGPIVINLADLAVLVGLIALVRHRPPRGKERPRPLLAGSLERR